MSSPERDATNPDERPMTTADVEREFSSALDRHAEDILPKLIEGASIRSIAREYGMAPSSVSRWVRRPDVAKDLDEARDEALRRVLRSATHAATKAVEVLNACMDDVDAPWGDRVRAAGKVLDLVGMERVAGAVDRHADAVEMSAQERLREKARAYVERASVIDVEPRALRAVDE